MTRFVAVDVETANARYSSICQIGAVLFEGGREVDHWTTLVDPEDDFRDFNVALHGIDAAAVRGAPLFAQAHNDLSRFVGQVPVLASYSTFDPAAFRQARLRYGVADVQWRWADVAGAARDAWSADFSDGWRLKSVCRRLGVALALHHDALSDARAAGQVFVLAQRATNTLAVDWLDKVRRVRTGARGDTQIPASMLADVASGALSGKRVVFTGELSMPRAVAAALAEGAGAEVSGSVGKKVSIVVVGDQDLARVGLDGKSGKQQRAEELIAQGVPIAMLGEMDFLKLINRS